MIIVAATLTAKPGKREALLKVAAPCVTATRKEDGCISYTPYLSVENDDDIFVFEQWASKAALDAHMQTAHFKELGAAGKELMARDLQVKIFETKD